MATMTNKPSSYSSGLSGRIRNAANIPQAGDASHMVAPIKGDGARQCLTHRTSHHREQTTGRRTARTFRHLPAIGFQNVFVAAIIIISTCCSVTAASPRPLVAEYPAKITDPLTSVTQERRSSFERSEPLLIDLRPPPPGVAWHYDYNGEVLDGPEDPYLEDNPFLQKRQDLFGDNTQSTTTSSKSSSTTSTSHSSTSTSASSSTRSSSSEKPSGTSTQTSSTLASTTDSGGLATATSEINTVLPSPFDSSLGNNFTTPACPAFITSFLAEAQFKACLPISLLLQVLSPCTLPQTIVHLANIMSQNSNSFFQAEKSVVRITQVLDATCAASSSTCAPYLSSLAANLTAPANCQADFQARNPTVLQAYTGLLAYLPLYSATCLKNAKTNSYCFADAITNVSSPTDSYVYFLPLNMSLPASSQPTCNSCLQNTMSVFNAAASNRTQAIADTYSAAAQQINVQCGPSFVQGNIPAATSGATYLMHGNMGLVALVMCVLAIFI